MNRQLFGVLLAGAVVAVVAAGFVVAVSTPKVVSRAAGKGRFAAEIAFISSDREGNRTSGQLDFRAVRIETYLMAAQRFTAFARIASPG